MLDCNVESYTKLRTDFASLLILGDCTNTRNINPMKKIKNSFSRFIM